MSKILKCELILLTLTSVALAILYKPYYLKLMSATEFWNIYKDLLTHIGFYMGFVFVAIEILFNFMKFNSRYVNWRNHKVKTIMLLTFDYIFFSICFTTALILGLPLDEFLRNNIQI